jgi:hypothetical protein
MVEARMVATMDEPLAGDNVAWAAHTIALAPVFATPFPRRLEGLLFEEHVLSCFGLWMALPDGLRDALTAQARPLWHREPDDFAVLLSPRDGSRLVVACIPGASTLAAAHVRVARAFERAGSWWRQLRRPAGFRPRDVLKLPELSLRAERGATRLTVELAAGHDAPFPEGISLGRAELYDRYYVADRPFFLWYSPSGTALPELVAWLPRPFAA